MKHLIRFAALLLIVGSVGCATDGIKLSDSKDGAKIDPKAVEKARSFLANHYGLDFRFVSIGGVCAQPKVDADWKVWVQAAGTCVQKQDWSQVEKLGSEMSLRQMDSPWGAYFLGVAAAHRGEMLRAHWMFDLAEKKAGSAIGLVRYEKARIAEKEDGVAEAAMNMKEAVRLDPTLMPGLLWLAQVHHRDRMNSDAEKYYRAVIALKADVYPAVAGLSELMIESKNGLEAADFLNRAMTLKPEVAETRAKLAMVYETLLKAPAKALQTLRELRVALEKGRTRGKVGFDLGAKIKQIEETMKPEATAQARDREPANKSGDSLNQQKKGG